MKIAITGASGFVGSRLTQHFAMSHEIFELHRDQTARFPPFDLNRPATLRATLEGIDADVIIHAGGMARRALCESAPERAYAANVDATRVIAKWCAENGIRMLFFSSIGIYENNTYANTKRMAERIIEEIGAPGSTFRLAYTFGMSPSMSRPNPQMRLEAEIREQGSQIFDRSWMFQPTSLTHLCEVVELFLARKDTFPRKVNVVTTEQTTMSAMASACLGYDVRSCLSYKKRMAHPIDTEHLIAAGLPTYSLYNLYREIRRLRFAR